MTPGHVEYWETRAERTGKAIESDGGGATPDPETVEDLQDAIAALESVEWSDVPNVGTPTAAVFTAMLRRTVKESGDRNEPGPQNADIYEGE